MDNKPIRILLIEDNAGDARIIKEQLKENTEIIYVLQCVSQLQEGLTYLNQNETDIVLSDLSLPDSPGLETFKRLHSEVSKVPVVVVTGFDNESTALDAVREGAQDYLIKGQIDARGLSRTILYAIERHRTQSTLRSLSLTDELTGLYNRRGFMTLGEQALKSALRSKSDLYLYYADLDGLKKINDTFGHPEGDRAISGAAEVLKKTFRQSDIVARIGGDEFAILSAEAQGGSSDLLISRLYANLAHYNLQNPREYKLSMSIGTTRFNPKMPVSIEELMGQADKVLYVRKTSRKNSSAAVPSKKKRYAWPLAILTATLLALVYLKTYTKHPVRPVPAPLPRPTVIPVSIPPPAPLPAKPVAAATPVQKKQITLAPKPKSKPLPLSEPTTPAAIAEPAAPAAVTLHRELIPENIAITRITYQQTIVAPGTRFTFEIVGSGFTPEFQKVLAVYSGSPHIQAQDLRLATVNEIRGELVIDADAATQYLFPYILINNTPVFRAANPFAIIRRGDVLNIVFTQMAENGHAGHFRIYTNLDSELSRQFHIVPSNENLEISPLEFNLPYRVDGVLRINDSVPHGDYGLSAFLGPKEVFRKDNLIQITRPMLGSTGFIQKLTAQEPFRRPGDSAGLVIQGSGFTPGLATLLSAKVDGMDGPAGSFHYVSPGRLEGSLFISSVAAEKTYNVTLYQGRDIVFQMKNVFSIVPPNWIESLDVAPHARPGQKSLLKVLGRDFTRDFVQTLELETDDPGIHLTRPVWVNASTVSAEMTIDYVLTPGDYVINLKSKGISVKPQGGNLVTVSPT